MGTGSGRTRSDSGERPRTKGQKEAGSKLRSTGTGRLMTPQRNIRAGGRIRCASAICTDASPDLPEGMGGRGLQHGRLTARDRPEREAIRLRPSWPLDDRICTAGFETGLRSLCERSSAEDAKSPRRADPDDPMLARAAAPVPRCRELRCASACHRVHSLRARPPRPIVDEPLRALVHSARSCLSTVSHTLAHHVAARRQGPAAQGAPADRDDEARAREPEL